MKQAQVEPQRERHDLVTFEGTLCKGLMEVANPLDLERTETQLFRPSRLFELEGSWTRGSVSESAKTFSFGSQYVQLLNRTIAHRRFSCLPDICGAPASRSSDLQEVVEAPVKTATNADALSQGQC
jgi:hypothetical protein